MIRSSFLADAAVFHHLRQPPVSSGGCLAFMALEIARGSWSSERQLRTYLDEFVGAYPATLRVQSDPVQFVHRYEAPADREVVGFLAAAFAYGNVRSILKSVEVVVSRIGPRPSAFVEQFDPVRDAGLFEGFTHRWNTGEDLAALLWILRRFIEEYGSIESAFVRGMSSRDSTPAAALDRFAGTALGFGHQQFRREAERRGRPGVRTFFPRASDGSACKRLNLFLRWMVRRADGVDCGVWTRMTPDQLVIPLDTHIARIARYIGLTDMRSPGWSMAVDVTRALKRLDPSDPLKYDFPLCHLGIARDCPRKRTLSKCGACPIEPVCLL